VSDVRVIAAYALRESLRRRVFLVVAVLTVLFLVLYTAGAITAFDSLEDFSGQALVDERILVGSTIFGLAMFATLFLGAVLAVFLTVGAVSGEADQGTLQPLVVRPVGRTVLLAGRFVAAALVCAAYVAVVYLTALLITGVTGDWWPGSAVAPGAGLVAGVVIVAALSLLGSNHLSTAANGIAVFMTFGAGLTAGLLGQIGEALDSDSLESIGHVASWLLPFEALYQDGLHSLTAGASGFTRVAVELGPFGGAQGAGWLLWPWSLAYLAVVGLAARAAFLRRDL
jgi:ABC-type transport system involved in multi-copper enzyme maturation permease subunit